MKPEIKRTINAYNIDLPKVPEGYNLPEFGPAPSESMVIRVHSGEWEPANQYDVGSFFIFAKQKRKIIDLESIQTFKIDCHNGDDSVIGPISTRGYKTNQFGEKENFHYCINDQPVKRCEPRLDHWHANIYIGYIGAWKIEGIPEGFIMRINTIDGNIYETNSLILSEHLECMSKVRAFKIIGVMDEYDYEWWS